MAARERAQYRAVLSALSAHVPSRVLDPVERVSEMCFGLFMALTFVGAVSISSAQHEKRTMLYAALGCNLAWGLVDAVMYLVRTITYRGEELRRVGTVQRAEFHGRDLSAAIGIFLIVVLSTFPVALPFVLLDDVREALLLSRALTLAMLFGGGVTLAQHAGYPAWKGGLLLVGLGVALTLAIVALGG